ncbi:MAG: PorV/PorQ family protein [Elusimicrobia bacterium]|nr:PorV/PorQ family protein [Elusimicrobiota bacterium]
MKRLALATALALVAAQARAAETAGFLAIGVGARGLGMGGAYTALADDAHALYWNPAGLAALDRREAAVDDAELATGPRLNFFAVALPTKYGTAGAAVTYLSQPSLEGRDAAGHPTAGFNASDFAGAAAFARKTAWADLGATVKVVQSHIGSAQATAAALDLGARRAFDAGPGRLVLGAALRDLGPGLKYQSETDDLPLRLAGGAAYVLPAGHVLAVEATNGPRGAGTDVGVGGEYQAMKGVFLRAGYTTQSATPGGSGLDAASGLTLGAGLRYGDWRFDYAAVPSGELGAAHRFSLAVRW